MRKLFVAKGLLFSYLEYGFVQIAKKELAREVLK
jgi:hypothetical protein